MVEESEKSSGPRQPADTPLQNKRLNSTMNAGGRVQSATC